MKKMNFMKKIFSAAGVLLAAGFVCLGLTGCPSAEGLHNQEAAEVTFVFTNFPETISGNYSIPGNFDGNTSWTKQIDDIDIVMKNGEGTSNPITVTTQNIQWSLVETGDTAWNRLWYPTVKGNGSDSGVMRNFYIDGLDLSAGEITILIDGISGTAVPEVQ